MLDRAPVGRPLQVLATRCTSPALHRRLAELGLRPGASVLLLARTSGGGGLLGLGDDRLAVARTVLAGVEVALATEPPGAGAPTAEQRPTAERAHHG
ncbi:MAG: ferrous iron transport protein A [Candidatus Nanopelagicales bacterium]|jgi:Fe2+ transport system protein FeoA|nr:ferrous iron transport protein A [Candidatus Nanopelagicales bacterium]